MPSGVAKCVRSRLRLLGRSFPDGPSNLLLFATKAGKFGAGRCCTVYRPVGSSNGVTLSARTSGHKLPDAVRYGVTGSGAADRERVRRGVPPDGPTMSGILVRRSRTASDRSW